MVRRSVDPTLEAEIARLPALGLADLRSRWNDLYGRPAPRFFRRRFLVLGIAYQMQVKALGGLSAPTKRKLQQVAEAKKAGDESLATIAPRIKPGTKLIRVWRDKTHTVTARDKGFDWQGAHYRSFAPSTPASPPRKGWSRTSTRCTRSARPARRSSRARRTKAGVLPRPPMTMAAIRAGRWSGRPCSACWPISARALIDVVVVYKVDRLTRSLADFAKMVEVFDAGGVSFVSVTQQFNTTTSMGRLTLNVLLSFAQFEREVTGERIRDKIAASKKKGMWMGGVTRACSPGFSMMSRVTG